jgi:ubiquinone/menaquinone biosynthesis C-methylase UbiE
MSKFQWKDPYSDRVATKNHEVFRPSKLGEKTILDLGGDGSLTKQLDQYKWREIYAVEPNPAMFKMLKKVKLTQNKLTKKRGDSCKIPLPSKSIDIIFIGTALHWKSFSEC